MTRATRRRDTGASNPGRSGWAATVAVGLFLALGALIDHAPPAGAQAPPPVAAQGAPAVTPGQLNAVTTLSSTDAWAVGLTQSSTVLIEHYNGSSWRPVRAPNPGYVNQLSGVSASAPNDVWAVGSQFYSGATQHYDTLVEHYDGATWSVVPSPNLGFSDHLVSVKAVTRTNVWAVGWVEESGSGDRTLIEHYNGTSWSVASTPNPTTTGAIASTYFVDTLAGVWATGPTDVWAVGAYYPKANNYYEAPLILHWNGRVWRQVPSPVRPGGAAESYLDGVSGSSAGDLTAVGARYTNHWMGLIEHWNGSSWQVAASPDPAGSTDTQLAAASALSPRDTWAVGVDHTAGSGVSERLGARGWSVVPVANQGNSALEGVSADAPNDAWAVGVALYGSYVYTVIDHWNGSTWKELTALP